MQHYKAAQLPYFIASLKKKKFSGVINLEAEASPRPRNRVLAFYQGWMTYAGEYLINAPELAKLLGRQFKRKFVDSALQLAQKRGIKENSIHDYLDLFVRLELFEWQEVETFMEARLVSMLEPLIPYGGTISPDVTSSFDLYYSDARPGFRWTDLQPIYTERQKRWTVLTPVIPSLDAIPKIIKMDQVSSSATQHINQWVDGQRSLLDIAIALEEDQLNLAQSYYKWSKKGWLSCAPTGQRTSGPVTDNAAQPIVLSVDDSQLVQTLIKRAIHDRYKVMLANNAVDALNILNTHKVALALLDVTMPDIDGLELCRTIRSISKFRNLPIVMLTAKDGVFNKLKGQMAGSTHYLIKPITREKLLDVLEMYVPTTKHSEI